MWKDKRSILVAMLVMATILAMAHSVQAEDDRQGVPDPLIFSTFVGGGDADWPHATVVGPDGTIYVTGYTLSNDFPTTDGAYQRVTKGNEEVYVLRLSQYGSELLWATLIGGSGQDIAWDLALGTDGRVYVTGLTRSPDFPTTQGAYLRTREGGSDAFVLCLAPDGGSLVYSTLLGGEDDDQGYAIQVLADGRAVVAGNTGSMFFPTTNGAYDRALGGVEDVFVTRLSSNGKGLEASTYLGGSYTEAEPSMALDVSGGLWITGSTTSQDFPTTAGLPNDWNIARDVFVTAIDYDLAHLIRSTVVGQIGADVPRSIDIGPGGEVMVAGFTHSPEFPDTGPVPGNDNNGHWDGFILVYKNNLESREHQWLYGGDNYDVVRTALYDAKGLIHVVGYTNSTNFPTTLGSYRPGKSGDDHDMFYMQVDPADDFETLNSTYIGKRMGDFGMDLAFNNWSVPIIVGHTRSADFPTPGDPFDDTYDDGGDIIILMYTTDEEPPEFWNDTTPGEVATGANITFSIDITDATGLWEVHLWYEEGKGDFVRPTDVILEGDDTYSTTVHISHLVHSLSYQFTAWDFLGYFNNTERRYVNVIDMYPPDLVSDETMEEGTTGDPFEFRLQVYDNWRVEMVNVEYVIGDEQVNISMTEIFSGGTNENWNMTIHLAPNSLAPITYRFNFRDHAGNTVTTLWTTVPVLDDEAPVLGDLTVPLFAQPGTTVTVRVNVSDNIGVQKIRLDHYITPSAVETINIAGPSGPTIEVEVPIPLDNGELHVEFHVEDAAGNTASIAGVIPFRDEDPPQMHITHDNRTTTGGVFNVTWFAEDPAGILEMWGFYVFGDGHVFEEYTFFNADGLPSAHYSIDIPEDSIEPLLIILASRDMFRNHNQTEPIRIDVLDDDPPWMDILLFQHRAIQDSTFFLDVRMAVDNIGVVLYEWTWTTPRSMVEMTLNSTEPTVEVPLTEKGVYIIEVFIYDAAGNHWNDTVGVAYSGESRTRDDPWADWPIWATAIGVAVLIIAIDLWFRRKKKARLLMSGET